MKTKDEMPEKIYAQRNGEEYELGYRWQNYPLATEYTRSDLVPELSEIRQKVCELWQAAVIEFRVSPGSNVEKNVAVLLGMINGEKP